MSSLLLRKLAACPACKNICKDPHTLPPCGHTICKGCTGLDSNELTLKCPVCDHKCDRSEITLDEPMSAFLEKVEQQRSQRNQNEDTGDRRPLCALCQTVKASHWCQGCKDWLCAKCLQAHLQLTTSENHYSIPLSSTERFKDYEPLLKNIEKAVEKVDISETEALKIVDYFYNAAQRDVDSYFQAMELEVKSIFRNNMEELDTRKAHIEEEMQKVKRESDQLIRFMKSPTQENLERLSTDFQPMRSVDLSDIIASCDAFRAEIIQWELNSTPKLRINDDLINIDPLITDNSASDNWEPLLKSNNIFDAKYYIELDYAPKNIRMIEGELWTCQENGTIEVFDTDLNLLNTIENRAFHTINDVAMLRDGTLVLASSYALYHVTTGGEQLELIKYGNFKSACVVNEKVFVYKSQPGKPCVLVYVYNGVWNMESSFDLPFGGFVTLSAHRDTLTACSPNKGQLYRLNSKGEILETFGDPGSFVPGQFKRPFLCQEDHENGVLLVADQGNNQLQVHSAKDGWTILPLAPHIKQPIRALYFDDAMFVLSESKAMLYKCGPVQTKYSVTTYITRMINHMDD